MVTAHQDGRDPDRVVMKSERGVEQHTGQKISGGKLESQIKKMSTEPNLVSVIFLHLTS